MSDFEFGDYKVLVCETQKDIIEVAEQAYEDAGVKELVLCSTAKDALNKVHKAKPDILLVALKLPDQSGIELIQKIRSMDKGAFYTTPILLLIDKVSQNVLREACRAGIEGALRKPITPDKILRFSRAVLIKPRRFICVRHYFGPERRMRDDPHYGGDDRRGNHTGSEEVKISTRTETGGNARGAVLSSGRPAWAADNNPPKVKSSGGKLDYKSGELKSKTASNVGSSIELGNGAVKPTNKGNADYALTEGTPPKRDDFDFGISETKKKTDNASIDFSSTEKRKKANEDLAAAESEKIDKKKKTPDVADNQKKDKALETADEPAKTEEEYEEIIDLEQCLELHKEWINSGGKSGQQANRPHSDFRGQELEEADFTAAVLPQSNFDDVKCSKVVLRKADLRGSTFKNALLSGADLRVSRLVEADMRNARMDKANLLGADLTGANLEGATLRGVNLSGANLTRANLRGVNLATVQGLIPDQIKRAITDQSTRLPLDTK